MSRENTPPSAGEEIVLWHPAPRVELEGFDLQALVRRPVHETASFGASAAQAHRWSRQRANHGSIGDSPVFAGGTIASLGYPRGHTVARETGSTLGGGLA